MKRNIQLLISEEFAEKTIPESEGAFGVIKENYKFRQFLLRGTAKVTAEIVLISMAYNINKLHHKDQDNRTGTQLHGKLSA